MRSVGICATASRENDSQRTGGRSGRARAGRTGRAAPVGSIWDADQGSRGLLAGCALTTAVGLPPGQQRGLPEPRTRWRPQPHIQCCGGRPGLATATTDNDQRPRCGPGSPVADPGVRVARGLRQPAARVPQAVLGDPRNLHARAGRRWWRAPARQRRNQPRGRGGGTGPDGDGDHSLHGRRLWRPPEPRRLACIRDAPRLSLAARRRLHRGSARRRHACVPVPAGSVRQCAAPRSNAAGPRV